MAWFGVVVVISIWFTIGVIKDLRVLFQRLRHLHRNVNDDGETLHESMKPAQLPGSDSPSIPDRALAEL